MLTFTFSIILFTCYLLLSVLPYSAVNSYFQYNRDLGIQMSLVYLELWNLVDLVPVSANLRETLKQLLQYKAAVLTDVPHALLHLITWVISLVVKWVISPVVKSYCTKTASKLTASGHLYHIKSPLKEDCQQIHHYTALVSCQILTERRLSTNTSLHSISIMSNPHWMKTVSKYITTQH